MSIVMIAATAWKFITFVTTLFTFNTHLNLRIVLLKSHQKFYSSKGNAAGDCKCWYIWTISIHLHKHLSTFALLLSHLPTENKFNICEYLCVTAYLCTARHSSRIIKKKCTLIVIRSQIRFFYLVYPVKSYNALCEQTKYHIFYRHIQKFHKFTTDFLQVIKYKISPTKLRLPKIFTNFNLGKKFLRIHIWIDFHFHT